jgi:hypothetical protein
VRRLLDLTLATVLAVFCFFAGLAMVTHICGCASNDDPGPNYRTQQCPSGTCHRHTGFFPEGPGDPAQDCPACRRGNNGRWQPKAPEKLY